CAVVSVLDRGPGIDQSEGADLFTPFIRGDRARSTKDTGLSLAIVKRIADSHGISVPLLNRPGGGTEAQLMIPVQIAPAQRTPWSVQHACLLHVPQRRREYIPVGSLSPSLATEALLHMQQTGMGGPIEGPPGAAPTMSFATRLAIYPPAPMPAR